MNRKREQVKSADTTQTSHHFRRAYPLLLFILGIAAYLRLAGLDNPGLWLDEVSYTIAAQRPIINQITNATETLGGYLSVDPTLSAISFSVSLFLGSSNFFVRLPAAIFGILSVALIYRTGRELLGVWPGLVAAFLLCVSSFHVLYSQEGRSYSQFIFFSLASFLFFYKAVTTNRPKFWGWYAVATWAAVSTNHLMIFAIAVQGFCLLLILVTTVDLQRFSSTSYLSRAGYFCGALVGVALFRLPWLEDFTQRQCAGCNIGQPSYSIDLVSSFAGALTTFSSGSVLVLVILGPAALVGCGVLFFKERDAAVLLTVWFVLSIVVSTIGLWFISQFYHPRYTIWGLPAYLLLAAYGVVTTAKLPLLKNRQVLAVLVGGIAVAIGLINIYQIQQNVQTKQRWPLGMLQEAAGTISGGAGQDEVIIAIGIPMQHVKYYIEQERQDLIFIDEQTFAEESRGQSLPDRFAGRWYVLHNAYAAPNIPPAWIGYRDYDVFYDLLVVHIDTPCRLEACITQTKALLLELSEANPDSSLAERANSIIHSFNILQLQ